MQIIFEGSFYPKTVQFLLKHIVIGMMNELNYENRILRIGKRQGKYISCYALLVPFRCRGGYCCATPTCISLERRDRTMVSKRKSLLFDQRSQKSSEMKVDFHRENGESI